jgi:CobQ-like glutamine amidotransferase family enzyme
VRLRIAHLYLRDMSLYGDTGNVVVLRKRLAWRGHDADVVAIEPGNPADLRGVDLVVGGGGPDRGQRDVASDLLARSDALHDALADGVPMLVVCGLFQLFGDSYVPGDGRALLGIRVFDAVSTASTPRITGPVVVDTSHGRLTGYENHGGVTRLGPGQQPLGRVRSGVGNGAGRPVDGAVAGTAYGTYLHGPVLAANPWFADHLLTIALRRHDPAVVLEPLPADGAPLSA